MTRYLSLFFIPALVVLSSLVRADDAPFPPVSELPVHTELPDPLRMMNGEEITTADEWFEKRRPELKDLFQHYMYGYLPASPEKIRFVVERENKLIFDGKAELRQVAIHYGPDDCPPIHLMIVVPTKRSGPVPVFLGVNFCGNHSALDDTSVLLPTAWLYPHCPGCENNKATDAVRGGEKEKWDIEQSIREGYAVATFYSGDVDPDKADFTDGVHPYFLKPGQTELDKHDWGTIAAWAYGLHRAVDYLHQEKDIDIDRIAVMGHSRLGKTALLAGAFDERIDLVIPHQAGCGGTAPSRHDIGESVQRINTVFPHWFNDTFPEFNELVERLPFDQHCLAAMVAPRPLLFTNAVEDSWADPEGQFSVLKAATPVYELLGVEGLAADEYPSPGQLIDSRVGYFIREGTHSTTPEDWKIFRAFADKHFGRTHNNSRP
ncbi:MAG: acetylxylan esterase [Planctomycetota bacterium]|nr:acetylxylan esterase [Planctomycetota bacterium]MDA1211218.1 acetylxylan esterase [Planctomycetota bacterium]